MLNFPITARTRAPVRRLLAGGAAVILCGLTACGDDRARQKLEYAPAPVDNPLKGLVPYAGMQIDQFPHSLEFDYLSFGALVIGPEHYDWRPLESLLSTCAGRGCQAVFRIYLEFPGRTGCLPEFLVKQGLKVHKYLNTNTQPFPPAAIETPDYEDPRLRAVVKAFIAELGRKYDGDPRIGFITAGLLGTWGEWHTYPRDELFASKTVQAEVLDAYEAAFKVTPVLLRYPAGPGHHAQTANADRPFGYHDDSFAWATLDTGQKGDEWFFMAILRAAGDPAVEKWKTRPIGGEIRPEAWGRVFDEKPGDPHIQDFRECVRQTHVSWLLDSGLFKDQPGPARRRRAEDAVRLMGYEFHARSVMIGKPAAGRIPVSVEVENRGVAPFYCGWTPEFGLITDGEIRHRFPGTGKLTGLLPGAPPRLWQDELLVRGITPGTYIVALRIANPLPKGRPLRFANRSQDKDLPGWLTLGEIRIAQP